jgi:hypothetical protein
MAMRLLQRLVVILLTAAIVPVAKAAPDDTGVYHIFPMSGLLGTRPNPLARSQNTAQTMRYYGGPVLPRIKVVSVIWGRDVARATVANIGPFLQGLVNSTFVDQLKQYSTNLTGINGVAGTRQTIGRGIYKGQFTITPIHKATTLSDLALQNELKAQIAARHLPAADQNTLYMIYFPSYVTITAGKQYSCVQFAAYHSATPNTVGGNVFYGVMPDCGYGLAALTIASSHEFAEALTDGIPTPGVHPKYPQAWNTVDGNEIADLCEHTRSALTVGTKRYFVQQVFLNSTNNCSTGTYHSP